MARDRLKLIAILVGGAVNTSLGLFVLLSGVRTISLGDTYLGEFGGRIAFLAVIAGLAFLVVGIALVTKAAHAHMAVKNGQGDSRRSVISTSSSNALESKDQIESGTGKLSLGIEAVVIAAAIASGIFLCLLGAWGMGFGQSHFDEMDGLYPPIAIFAGVVLLTLGNRMLATARAKRKPAQLPAVTCPSCGYDLTGNQSGLCPECGKKLTSD